MWRCQWMFCILKYVLTALKGRPHLYTKANKACGTEANANECQKVACSAFAAQVNKQAFHWLPQCQSPCVQRIATLAALKYSIPSLFHSFTLLLCALDENMYYFLNDPHIIFHPKVVMSQSWMFWLQSCQNFDPVFQIIEKNLHFSCFGCEGAKILSRFFGKINDKNRYFSCITLLRKIMISVPNDPLLLF